MNDLNLSRNRTASPGANWFLALFLLAGWAAMVTPLRADNPPTYLFEIDSSAVPGGLSPDYLAVDSNNSLYVTDLKSNRVVKFSANGRFLTQWGGLGSGNGQFNYPNGIAVDSGNYLYVADFNNNRVEKFDNNGNYLAQWASHGSGNSEFAPQVLAADGNSLYLSGWINGTAEKLSGNGAYLAQFGGYGNGNGTFIDPAGMAVDPSHNIYVADYSDSHVEKFDQNGIYLAQFGNGHLFCPYGVAVDSNTFVYVVDNCNNNIQKFDSNGNYLTQWGSSGSGNGQFSSPRGIAVDRSGNLIYVAEFPNSRIQVFVYNTNIGPPIITSQPMSQIVPAGSNVTFSAGLVGSAPFAYQWTANDVPLAGATNAVLTLTNVSLSDSGTTYRLLVTNDFDSALSSNAVLTVLPAEDFLPPRYLFEIDAAIPGGFHPNFVAVDQSNNVYVVDSGNSRVSKFDRSGNYLAQWGNLGQFQPDGIAVDGSNNVYVADAANYRIEKFDSKGHYLAEWGSLGQFQPEDVAVDASNNVYVADIGNNWIEKFDSNGNVLAQWGSYGTSNGQFRLPEGVAVDGNNNVYVVDYFNSTVQKFDSNGNFLTQWGGFGSYHGQFEYADHIAADRSNNVYVNDPLNNRIKKFDNNGNYLTQWGSYGTDNGQFNGPQGLAVDSSGNFVYVADYGNARVQVFAYNTNIGPPVIVTQPKSQAVPARTNITLSVSATGTAPLAYQWSSNHVVVLGATNANFTLGSISPSASGSTYSVVVSNELGSQLSRNAVLTILPAADFVPPTYLFEIDSSAVPGGVYPNFLALDDSNNIYVTDLHSSRVVKFDRNGNYLTNWSVDCTGNGFFDHPEGIAVDSSNNVYVVDYFNSCVEKFSSSGAYLSQWGTNDSGNGALNRPTGIAVDGSNNVYLVDAGNNRVEKLDGSGDYLAQLGSYGNGSGQFNGSQGLAVDSSNNVYVVDSSNHRVEKFDSSGDYLTQWGRNGTNDGQFSGLYGSGPVGIAVDGSNHVYVADSVNNRVEKFDGNGNYLTQLGSYGTNNGQFNSPQGVALDSTGNFIFVADYGNNRIQVFVNDTNLIPPFIAQQPRANQAVPAGSDVTLNIGVIGAALAYQWTSNGVAVDGATNADFTLANISLSASATYAVLVSNSYGSVLSSNTLLTVLPAADFLTPTFLLEIGFSTLPGRFYPGFLALDSSNNLYAGDHGNTRIVRFDSNGNYLSQWGGFGSGSGQFGNIQGVALDGSNNVYVVDYSNARVEKFDNNGNYVTQWGSFGSGNGQFAYPLGVAVDSSNNVYVVDYGNNRVEKFDNNGNYLAQWGGYGTNIGQFTSPSAIAVDSSNNVYVVDYARVEKFDSNGSYLAQWGSRGTNNGQFQFPEGIAVDSSDNVYVADSGNNRVEKFDSNGNYLTQWGSASAGIAVDRTGNLIYVADYSNNQIDVFVNNINIVPPIINSQPVSRIVQAGANVTFTVGIVGSAPFAYQWNSNNVAVPGATNAFFTLSNVNLSASGNYSALIANSYGSDLSSNAFLTVLPALVTTQPPSGLSATGAVLNGTAIIGLDETVAWFDWGTDTNYGNIAGTTVVPGNNGSNNVSATLTGLPGNFYHYRLVAANDFGIVYGGDQFFTVGFAPSPTTLPPTNGANGATLNAMVNPNGWDTTVYFQWGTTNFGNTAPGLDIGAGITSLNVSTFVPGLSASVPYKYQVVAFNALGRVSGNIAFGDPDQHHFFFSGSKTNITLPPGTYIITAYGAAGGYAASFNGYAAPGRGAEMSAEFSFSAPTTLTLLVGRAGGTARHYPATNFYGGGGGGGSFVVAGTTPLVIAGGGGGGAVSGRSNPLTVDGGNARTDTGGGAGDGISSGGFNNLFGQFPSGGAGGINGGGGSAGGGDGVLGYGGGGGGGFDVDGGDGFGSGGGAGGSSFIDDGGGGIASYDGGDYRGDYSGGFGGGGAGYGNLGNSNFEFGFGGGGGGYSGGGGGGGDSGSSDGFSAHVQTVGGGGGGGSIIDSSAITILTQVTGIFFSPEGGPNGEIIITLVPQPPLAITPGAASGFTNGVFGFNVSGPSGSNVVIQASMDLHTWIPLQTNQLGSGPLNFSDSQSTTNRQRFYRAQLSP